VVLARLTQRIAVAAALLAAPDVAASQSLARFATSPKATAAVLVEHAGSGTPARAFAIEAAGGVTGSLLGFGLVYLVDDDDCSVEDLGCHLENAFLGIALATVGSTAGTYLAGRGFDTRPSFAGAGLGAVVGAAAGIDTWHFFTEELDLVNKTEAAVVVWSHAGNRDGARLAAGARRALSWSVVCNSVN
jgi:hypothetical protein